MIDSAFTRSFTAMLPPQISAASSAAEQPTGASDQPEPWGVTPYEVVYTDDTLRLLRYRPQEPSPWAEPLLICFALVNRPYVLDLQESRSVIRQLVDHGFDVFLIDWGVPTDAHCSLGLHDYICGKLKGVADFVCQQSPVDAVNLLGYCMGGTMSTMFTALFPQRVRNLILLAAPIDFDGDEGLLNLWTREEYFDVDGLIDAFGNCPSWFLQSCFQLMKPVQNFVEKYIDLGRRLGNESLLDNFLAMEQWANDGIPVAGRTFREYVKFLYQQNQLTRGELALNGQPIELAKIECPVLLLVAEHDHLVPPSSTLALQQHVNSTDVESLSVDSGHIGLAVSSKAHRGLWPRAAKWIADRSTARVTPETSNHD